MICDTRRATRVAQSAGISWTSHRGRQCEQEVLQDPSTLMAIARILLRTLAKDGRYRLPETGIPAVVEAVGEAPGRGRVFRPARLSAAAQAGVVS